MNMAPAQQAQQGSRVASHPLALAMPPGCHCRSAQEALAWEDALSKGQCTALASGISISSNPSAGAASGLQQAINDPRGAKWSAAMFTLREKAAAAACCASAPPSISPSILPSFLTSMVSACPPRREEASSNTTSHCNMAMEMCTSAKDGHKPGISGALEDAAGAGM